MSTALLYFIANVMESLVLWHYCSSLMTPKKDFVPRLVAHACGGLLCYLFAFLGSFVINMLVFCVVNFLIMYFFYEIRWYLSLFHVFLLMAMMWCEELIMLAVNSQIIPVLHIGNTVSSTTAILSLFSKFLYFCMAQFVIFLSRRSTNNNRAIQKKSFLIVLVPILSAIIFAAIAAAYVLAAIPQPLDLIFSVICVLLLLIDYLMFTILRQTQNEYQEYTKLQIQLQIEEDSAKYCQALQQQDEQMEIFRHDIRGHLHAARNLLQEEQYESAQAYLDFLLEDSECRMPIRISDNPNLNAIVSRYLRLAAEKEIIMLTDIRSQMLTGLSYQDLTSLLCNLLDNAFEAAAGLPDAKITLSIEPEEGTVYTIITVTNSCAENPYDTDGRLPSRKNDSTHHGYGIKSIQKVIEKYRGNIHMHYIEDSKKFHVQILLKEQARE